MSTLQTLMDMGFPQSRVEKALSLNNGVLEPAMEWLLAHAHEDIPDVPEQVTPSEEVSESPPATTDTTEDTSDDAQNNAEAKSLKCDECNKLFRSNIEVEVHAVKTGHQSFSESTEEKKPLSEEERKEQLAKIEERLKQKRVEREVKEKVEALERERTRIKSGKDMVEARRRLEEQEMQKILEQRRREKLEDKAARDRVKVKIEEDRTKRRQRMEPSSPEAPVITSAAAVSSTTVAPSNTSRSYANAKIQIRLQDGSTVTETFDAKEQLSAVRLFIQMHQGVDSVPFGLMTSFPRKCFTEDDYAKPLDVLGLVPSAVVIVTKV